MLKILILCAVLASALGEKFRFDNYTLYRITPKNENEIRLLQILQQDEEKFDFWTEPSPVLDFVSVLSAPQYKGYLENVLRANQVAFEITQPNIQELINKQTIAKYSRVNAGSMRWDVYYDLDDIYAWLDDLVRTYPTVASIVIGGTSHEGREIKGIRISHGSGRRIIFIESGAHSREWITHATTNYILYQLLTSDNPEIQAAARDFDWYIFPVTNPDGYVWTHTEFRMWRKNRRQFGDEFGVDLNRNWNNNWLGPGTSSNPASNTYAGPGPFSEAETRTLSAYISTIAQDIDIYLSMHSAGQLLLIPFGNTTEILANYDETVNIGRRAMGALAVRYGTPYTTGNTASTIYLASGSSIDWLKETHGVPIVYCYELRDRGTYGHLLPPDQILPTAEETLDSFLDLIFQARRFGIIENSAAGVHVTILSSLLVFVAFLLQ